MSVTSLLAGKRVLVCEDEAVTQMQICRILTRNKMTVVRSVNNGRDGVECALIEHPDIILMDIKMPIMDGLDAAEQILSGEVVCIVMLTAFNNPDYIARAERAGACGYIVKPIAMETFIPQLETAYESFSFASKREEMFFPDAEADK